MYKSLALAAAAVSTGLAATVSYDWDIEWVTAAPDGFERPTIGVNGKWPLPIIEATVGDKVVVNLHNKLGNETTGLHFHGIHQFGTNHMDGPAPVTQCPVPPGKSFKYEFTVDQSGSYWYHSHTGTQYPDGLRGGMIVKDADGKDPYAGKYDAEYMMLLSDWYHDQVPTLLKTMLSPDNTQSRPPIPAVGLVNEASNAVANTTYDFEPGKTYKIRIINMSGLASVAVFFDQHDMEIIEVDGDYVVPATTKEIYVAPAQRWTVLVKAKSDASANYPFQCVFDVNPDFALPGSVFPFNTTGWMVYDESLPLPPAPTIDAIEPFDDVTLSPLDGDVLLTSVDNPIDMDFNFGFDSDGIPRAFINDVSWVPQIVPTLYTALTVGEDANDARVYGQVNPFVLQKGQVVEIVLNNHHFAHHPFHLHGHHFQVVYRGAAGEGPFNGDRSSFPASPMQRDTITVFGNSSVVLRFKADNPGVWLFHCHLEWHVPMGLVSTMIEAPTELQKIITIPQQHIDACECRPTKGNAAGNTVDHFDLTGANTQGELGEGAIYDASAAGTCNATSTTSSTVGPTSSPTGTATGTDTVSPTGTHTTKYTTSTLYTTTTRTVTSCAPTVTNCPAGPHVTTETIPYTTTVCPVTEVEMTTSTLYSTSTTTIISCAPDVKDCPAGPHVTTVLIPTATTVCPVEPTDEVGANTVTATPTTFGTAAVVKPTETKKQLAVTAAAGKVAGGFGAVAAAGVFAAAALL